MGVKAFERKAVDAGALQAKLSKTSGAFHTPMMQDAKASLLTELQKVKGSMKPTKCWVYMNSTGQAVPPGTQPDDVIEKLGNQLTSPVQWQESIQNSIKEGCQEFYEIGPGKQLKAMMKRIDPKIA